MPQDDDVTELDEIVVIGQRRPAGSSGAYGGGGGRGTGAPDQYEVDDDPNPQPDGPGYDPCATPEGALEWNADAAAAEAVKTFERDAERMGEDGLNERERGAYLVQNADGSVSMGPIHYSEPYSSGDVAVTLTYRGIDPSQIIGSIHTHPPGQHRPSGPSPRPGLGEGDVGHFYGIQAVMTGFERDPGTARIYIAAQNQLGAGEIPHNQINVYDETNIEASQDDLEVGPEVNPDGLPCP